MRKCLYCYLPLENNEQDFHPRCSRNIFGLPVPPPLPYSEDKLEQLAEQVIKSHTAITGVQPKISLHLTKGEGDIHAKKFTIVGLWGDYILKPPTLHYPQLPETEDITMHLAAIANIKTVPHSLIRLQSGNLAYITKRIDRINNRKLHIEDMCQLTGRLTEDKYHGSYEQIAKAIQRYSATPGLDVINFFELVLFSFLTGNADMHLKNFSLLRRPGIGSVLAPAYDLVATKLVNPADDEDMALTLNGKKKRVAKKDFTAAFRTLGMEEKQQANIFSKMEKSIFKWEGKIDSSFLSADYKERYKNLLRERFARIL